MSSMSMGWWGIVVAEKDAGRSWWSADGDPAKHCSRLYLSPEWITRSISLPFTLNYVSAAQFRVITTYLQGLMANNGKKAPWANLSYCHFHIRPILKIGSKDIRLLRLKPSCYMEGS